MLFGRVDAYVLVKANGEQRVSVLLDTGREVITLRDEAIYRSLDADCATAFAEQFAWETLGNELACAGWTVVGEADTLHEPHHLLDVLARSRTWVVEKRA